jgi:hypothetical protein
MAKENAAAVGAGQIIARGVNLPKKRPPRVEKDSTEWRRRREMYRRVRREEEALKRIWKKTGLSRAAAVWKRHQQKWGGLPQAEPGSLEWRQRRKAQIIQMRYEQLREAAAMLKSGYMHESGTTPIMRLRAEAEGKSARLGNWQALGESADRALERRLHAEGEESDGWRFGGESFNGGAGARLLKQRAAFLQAR